MGNSLFFGQTDFTTGFAVAMFPAKYTTFVELWLLKMSNFVKTVFVHISFWGVRGGIWHPTWGLLSLIPPRSTSFHAIAYFQPLSIWRVVWPEGLQKKKKINIKNVFLYQLWPFFLIGSGVMNLYRVGICNFPIQRNVAINTVLLLLCSLWQVKILKNAKKLNVRYYKQC